MKKTDTPFRLKVMALVTTAMLLTITPQTMSAQKHFTLEDLNFGGINYHNMVPENIHTTWWGERLMYLDAEEGGEISLKDGSRKAFFNLKEINAIITDSDTLKEIHTAYHAKYPYPDKALVLLSNNKKQILFNFESKQVELSQDIEGTNSTDWSPISRNVAYTKNGQLYVRNADNLEKQVTTDGRLPDIVYGQSVHRDEFGIEKGTFWSPDGQRLAFYRMDQSMVSDYPQVNINARIAQYEPDKYPMAGETSHKVTVGVFDTTADKTIYLDAGDPTDRYFTNIAWSPDSRTLYMFELNRDQNDCQLVSYDAVTGKRLGVIYRETHPKYVEPLHPIEFLPWDNSKFIIQSQKDGYNHLYLYNTEGKQLKQLTSGQFTVLDILGFNKKDKTIIITSNEKSPIQSNIYSVSISTGKRTPLDNGRGYHQGDLSSNATMVLDRYSEPTVPRNIEVTPTTGNNPYSKTTRLLTADNPWEGYNIPIFECGTIKAADGITDLFYRMVKPADFNPENKYPTVVYVYGGPHAHNVDARWHYASRSWETYMAQKGYILFILDNRGSENRGREFEQATFRQLGQIEMEDQMKGVDFLKSLPYVDIDRMGVHGWSFGGFMTITMMVNHPEVFKVGVAGGPVIDWKWYEVMYGERYMDTPQSNPEGYEKTSLTNRAKDLKGKLQIITGYNDATVVPQHCLSFLDACIESGTQVDFFVYPGEPHNMRGHKSVHLHERITQYFEDFLK